MTKEKTAQIITKKCLRETYHIIASNHTLLQLVLNNTLEQKILQLYWHQNLPFSETCKQLGINERIGRIRYNSIIKKIPKRIDSICNSYLELLTVANLQDVKNSLLKKQIRTYRSNASRNNDLKFENINPKNLFLADILGDRNIKKVNILNSKNIYTLGNLTFYTQKEIFLLKGISTSFMNKLNALLLEHHLHFKK
jgi:hypothetical protein